MARCSAGPIFFTWLAQLLLPLLLVNMVYEKERGCEAQRGLSSLGRTVSLLLLAWQHCNALQAAPKCC